jgi:hypothetical protein
MTVAHDPELQQFKRTIDLLEYVKKAGYEPRTHDGGRGLTVLDHPDRHRIVVARSPSGVWIYASVPDYEPRTTSESPERAFERLRACILRSRDKGSIVEFVQQRDWTARDGEVGLETVRERLREYRVSRFPLDFEGPLNPPKEMSRPAARIALPGGEPSLAQGAAAAHEVPRNPEVASGKRELGRRRYDWTPDPAVPPETEVEQRLRRWREAQIAIDQKLSRALGVSASSTQSAPAIAVANLADKALTPGGLRFAREEGRTEKSELGRRRYDWTPPPPEGVSAIARGSRGRGKERGR